jgi:hypothetical protein
MKPARQSRAGFISGWAKNAYRAGGGFNENQLPALEIIGDIEPFAWHFLLHGNC